MTTLSRTRTTLIAGAALTAVLGAGGVAAAHGGGGGKGGARPAHGNVVHSESVHANGAAGYVTRVQQFGTIRALAPASSVTVESADGFTRTYALDASTKYSNGRSAATATSFAVGDTVSVDGRGTGTSLTATRLDKRTPKPSPSATPAVATS